MVVHKSFRSEPCTFRTLKHNSFIETTWAGCVDIVTGHLLAGWFIFMGKVIIAFVHKYTRTCAELQINLLRNYETLDWKLF